MDVGIERQKRDKRETKERMKHGGRRGNIIVWVSVVVLLPFSPELEHVLSGNAVILKPFEQPLVHEIATSHQRIFMQLSGKKQQNSDCCLRQTPFFGCRCLEKTQLCSSLREVQRIKHRQIENPEATCLLHHILKLGIFWRLTGLIHPEPPVPSEAVSRHIFMLHNKSEVKANFRWAETWNYIFVEKVLREFGYKVKNEMEAKTVLSIARR